LISHFDKILQLVLDAVVTPVLQQSLKQELSALPACHAREAAISLCHAGLDAVQAHISPQVALYMVYNIFRGLDASAVLTSAGADIQEFMKASPQC
jgi:hypothetical protein